MSAEYYDQIIYALERAKARLDAEVEELVAQRSYDVMFPEEDAKRMAEAIEIVKQEKSK